MHEPLEFCAPSELRTKVQGSVSFSSQSQYALRTLLRNHSKMSYQDQYVLSQQQGYQPQQPQQQQQQPLSAPAAAAATPSEPAVMRRPFDPTAHDLGADFRLTKFADLKG